MHVPPPRPRGRARSVFGARRLLCCSGTLAGCRGARFARSTSSPRRRTGATRWPSSSTARGSAPRRCSGSPTGRTCRRPRSSCRRRTTGADYQVRIFTPDAELPFAGHPTLGTCHAWLEPAARRRRRRVVQECAAGLVPIRRGDAGLAFAAPPLVRSGRSTSRLVGASRAARHRPRRDRRRRVGRQRSRLGRRAARGRGRRARRCGRASSTSTSAWSAVPGRLAAAFEVRAFFPKDGATVEDPVTGSLNASLAPVAAADGPGDGAVRGQPGHGARPGRPRAHRRATTTARSGSAAGR